MIRRTVRYAALVAALGLLQVVPAAAQSCGASTHCAAISGVGLIFFGRDDNAAGFNSGGSFAGTNSVGAYNDFVSLVNARSTGGSATENGLGVQTFDGFNTSSNPHNVQLPSSQAISFGATGTSRGISGVAGVSSPTGAVVDAGDNGYVTTAGGDPLGNNNAVRFPVSGSNYLVDADDWTLNFTGAASAMGFFGIDIAEEGLDESLHLSIKNGASTLAGFNIGESTKDAAGNDRTSSYSCSFLQNCGGSTCYDFWHGCSGTQDDPFNSGNLFFFGFVGMNGAGSNNTFTSVVFDDQSTCHHNCDNDIFAYDNIYASGVYDGGGIGTGQAVTPEPASMTLLATGLVGLMAARRRRKR